MPTASKPKVLAFGGSLREGSFNQRLASIAADAARAAGAEVTLIRLRDFPMPVYDGDIEAAGGLPEHAIKLKQLFWDHQGLLMSCPEYNSSVSGAWKNAIDWVSRPGGWSESGRSGHEPKLSAFTDKVAGIMSASPGVLGGLRGLVHVRQILTNITVLVLPEQISVSRAQTAFTENNTLVDASNQSAVERIATQVVRTVERLGGK